MKKTIKYLLIMSILAIIFVFCNHIKSYAETTKEYIPAWNYIRGNVQDWWCVEHGPNAVNTEYVKSGPYYFDSNSDDDFKRAFAYIVKDGYDNNDAGYGRQDNGSNAGGGKHQLALWKLLYDYRSNGIVSKNPFKKIGVTVRPDANINIDDAEGIGVIGVGELYRRAISQKPIAYNNTNEGALIEMGPLKMRYNTNTGGLRINELKGQVKSITVKWEDGVENTLTYNPKTDNNSYINSYFGVYKNSECTPDHRYNINEIAVGGVYFKNYRKDKNKKSIKIKNVSITVEANVTNGNTGYRVGFYLYHHQDAQDMIRTFLEMGKPIRTTTNVVVQYAAEITVRKIDYDDNTLIDGSKFAIFGTELENQKDGWLGYDTTNSVITTGKDWKNAYKFETGENYCKQGKYTGEFTLDQLPYGKYYVFEVDTGSKEKYFLSDQPGYSTNSNFAFFTQDKWKMNCESVLIGKTSAESGFTGVGLADGTPYSFISWNYIDSTKSNTNRCNFINLSWQDSIIEYSDTFAYATNHATYTVRNRKRTKLTIVKKDKDTDTPLENVGIKVLVKTTEKRYTLNSYKWLKADGSVTDNVKDAYEFKTNKNGIIEIFKVPYGKYYIYETSTASDRYKLESQKNFMKGKPSDYTGNFLGGGYVYLGTDTISPKTNNDINNSNYKSPVIENGTYRIRSNLDESFFIRIMDYSTANRKNIQIGKFDKEKASYFNFRISYVSKDCYLIDRVYVVKRNDKNSNMRLYKPITIKDKVKANFTNVEQFYYNGSASQLWKFKRIGKNVYNIATRLDSNGDFGLHINATEPAEGTNIDIYSISEAKEKVTKGSTLKFNLISNSSYAEYNANGSREIEIKATNDSVKAKLTIAKKDGSYNEDLNQNEILRLQGAEIKIYATDLKNANKDKGWIKEVQTNDNGTEYVYGSYQDATEFKIGNTGNIELNGISYGNYYIYETKTPSGYPIKDQPGYKLQNEGSSDLGDIDWVFLGSQKIDDQHYDVIYNADNYLYVSEGIKGKVWIDNPDGKVNNINNIYDKDNNDKLLDTPITVNLYSNKDGKNGLIATTTTGENGEYEFKTKANGEKFTYWELAYCYVEFVYDNKEYITVTPFEGENVEINSKAQEKEIISTGGQNNMGELYDENLTGLDPNGAFPGKAITYQAQASKINVDTIKNNQNAPQIQRLLTSYYNSDTHTIENINLGLIKKIEPSFSVGQQIEYVKIVKGNYNFTYKMRRFVCNKYGGRNKTNSISSCISKLCKNIFSSIISF